MQFCLRCKKYLHKDKFVSERAFVCVDCKKKRERLKHQKYRRTNHNGYNDKTNLRTSRWRKTPKGLKTRREYMKRWSKTPIGRQNALNGLFRFIERHPEYSLGYLMRLVKINERMVELNKTIFDTGRRITQKQDLIINKKADDPAEIVEAILDFEYLQKQRALSLE